MIALQTTVKNNFNRAGQSYDLVACVQRQSAEFLVKKLLAFKIDPPKTIVDLGTGTGYMPALLLKHFPSASYLLNDIADKMLEVCQSKFASYDNFSFSNSDMAGLAVKHYNLVVSNLALQWVDDLWGVLKDFHTNSDIFAFSTLLNGTFEEWQNIINGYDKVRIIKQYPTREQLIDYCDSIKDNSQLYYWTKDFPVAFDNPLAFIKYLKNLGAGAADNRISIDGLKSLLKNKPEPFSVTYKIFFGIFKKVT